LSSEAGVASNRSEEVEIMIRRNFLKTIGTGSLAALYSGKPKEAAPANQAKIGRDGRMDSWVEIDLASIGWNFLRVKRHANVSVMAVVKANAYGHGLVEVSKTLEKAGADWLMVGKLREGIALRDAGISCPILNFGPWAPQESSELIERNISQSVSTEDASFLQEAASKLKKRASVHVDIDTGMGRTGIPYDKALPLIERIASFSRVQIGGICTTLTEDPEFDREQVRRLLDVCSSAKKKGIALGLRHASSSAGLLTSAEFSLDMVRPGITLYGYYPNARTQKEDVLSLRPALKLKARVVFLKDLAPGDSLSYLRAFKASKKMRVATVGIGYSDGYPPELGGKGFALIRGRKFPMLKAITANHAMVDLGDDREVEIGDEVVLMDSTPGSGMTADALAEQCGISDYRILIGLSPLLLRVQVLPG
jgi:alanine racemase